MGHAFVERDLGSIKEFKKVYGYSVRLYIIKEGLDVTSEWQERAKRNRKIVQYTGDCYTRTWDRN